MYMCGFWPQCDRSQHTHCNSHTAGPGMQVFSLEVCFYGYRSLLTFVAVGSVQSVAGGVSANSSAAPAHPSDDHPHSVRQKDTLNIYGKICIHQCRPKDWGIHNI